ncbi:SRPBCC family protein [Pedobacter antarcticus]|uniref:SRPBCC domain-containing protein n=2 Tax=Pedobacter antarcticus TaxID=34086 RepID=A0A081PLK2_9SPHI|nr:SRPBCC family protein [Pedobacter antarcticus]KEQ31575.1 SRPBCC domain-containing protein [Pedobacter antarcticus 4BY]SDM08504.1 Ligand-binding SRPBCC domain-containing protein [Pedobacter antarcticus]SFF41339.1 Ligand-binding SRPBCC domain-containing protein [Pedobacter antarcticus]
MKAHQLQFVQKMPVSLEQAWDFFSSPLNLAKITPEEMAFKVTSNINPIDKMYAGMIITYKVSPVAGIKLNWMTEITQVEEQRYFIDEQRFGPYQFWHHQHHFKSIPGGVEMTDVLTYGMPLGFLGTIANSLFVANKLQQIFKYRKEKVDALFGSYEIL